MVNLRLEIFRYGLVTGDGGYSWNRGGRERLNRSG